VYCISVEFVVYTLEQDWKTTKISAGIIFAVQYSKKLARIVTCFRVLFREKEMIPSALQMMTSSLQVGNKRLGSECEGRSFENTYT
jgi:hypothetical protein